MVTALPNSLSRLVGRRVDLGIGHEPPEVDGVDYTIQ